MRQFSNITTSAAVLRCVLTPLSIACSYIRQVPTEGEANLEKRPVLIEHVSAQHARLALFSKRVISIGEELTVHVGLDTPGLSP
jgi:hypothetical protein